MRCKVRLDIRVTQSVAAAGDVRDAYGEHQRLPCPEGWWQPEPQAAHRHTNPGTALRAIHTQLNGAYASPRLVMEIRGRGFIALNKMQPTSDNQLLLFK